MAGCFGLLNGLTPYLRGHYPAVCTCATVETVVLIDVQIYVSTRLYILMGIKKMYTLMGYLAFDT